MLKESLREIFSLLEGSKEISLESKYLNKLKHKNYLTPSGIGKKMELTTPGRLFIHGLSTNLNEFIPSKEVLVLLETHINKIYSPTPERMKELIELREKRLITPLNQEDGKYSLTSLGEAEIEKVILDAKRILDK